jgi:hypothetical protein
MYQMAVEKCTTMVNNIAPITGASQVTLKNDSSFALE